jgi:hypothetical protein
VPVFSGCQSSVNNKNIVERIKVANKECIRKSDLGLDCVSLALNFIPTKTEQQILIKTAGKERFDALRSEHKKGR